MGIFNKTNVKKSEAEVSEMPETNEDFTETALNCFGWEKENTEKWLVKCAKVWLILVSFLYFLFGAMTFAPIIFIEKKIRPLIKDKKKSFIISAVAYVIIICLFIFVLGFRHSPNANISTSS